MPSLFSCLFTSAVCNSTYKAGLNMFIYSKMKTNFKDVHKQYYKEYYITVNREPFLKTSINTPLVPRFSSLDLLLSIALFNICLLKCVSYLYLSVCSLTISVSCLVHSFIFF